jgi:hypothetical protein
MFSDHMQISPFSISFILKDIRSYHRTLECYLVYYNSNFYKHFSNKYEFSYGVRDHQPLARVTSAGYSR